MQNENVNNILWKFDLISTHVEFLRYLCFKIYKQSKSRSKPMNLMSEYLPPLISLTNTLCNALTSLLVSQNTFTLESLVKNHHRIFFLEYSRIYFRIFCILQTKKRYPSVHRPQVLSCVIMYIIEITVLNEQKDLINFLFISSTYFLLKSVQIFTSLERLEPCLLAVLCTVPKT